MNFLTKHITPILITYLIALVLLNTLPINGSNSALNNNYTHGLRWDYLGHALLLMPLFPLLMLKYNSLQPYTSSILLFFTISIAIAATLEGTQYFIPWRAFNLNDMMANGVGVLISIITLVGISRSKNYYILKNK